MRKKPDPQLAADPLAGLRIGVLCGGPSSEREVSLASGRAVYDALREAGRTVALLELAGDSTTELDRALAAAEVFFLSLHGRFGEDGTLQALLDARGVCYTGSGPEASRVCFDKVETRRVFAAHEIPHAPGVVLARETSAADAERAVAAAAGWPCVVKPAASGSSIGVTIVHRPEELAAALTAAFAEGATVLVEQYIAGRELTVGFVGERSLPIIELRPAREFYNDQAKYADDNTRYICPAELAPAEERRVRELSVRVWRVLGCRDLGRVDLILAVDGTPCFLEMNTLPGFTSHSLVPKAAAAAGLGFAALCEAILCSALARRRGASCGS